MSANVVLRVAQKELRLFFASPVAWFFLGSFAAVTLFVFFWVEAFFARNIADVRPLFEWLPLLLIFLAAALTMRMWSEERRNGTIEHVLTQPVPLWQFVAGKFLACVTLLLLALATTVPLPLTVAWLGNLDWGPVLAGYLATALLGSAYLSIGLFVSARTDNAMVSLMGSVLVAGFLYLLGSPLLTGFFGDDVGGVLRLLGTGSRFDSITRGVIDSRDLYYYLAVCGIFLTLGVYTLESERWAKASGRPRHRRWRLGTALLVLNLVVAGVWLQQLSSLRADVTSGRLYSISDPTHELLAQLEEPLLIRGYFSERTHPLLAPLVPQLKDLLREYAVAGGDRVRVEFVDPARNPDQEQQANEDFGIQATPFQVADRYQSALVNAYFDVLVKYGDEHETLSFGDLIEVKAGTGGQPDVVLRNPEFDITRGVRDVLYSYQAGGDLFAQLDQPLTFTAYVSSDKHLPERLRGYRDAIRAEVEAEAATSGGRFRVEFVDPEAGDGAVARRIIEEWGFQPMIASLDDPREFFFYLTLEDDHQVVQLPTGSFDPATFGDSLEAGIKRFASGFTKTVALALPGRGDPRLPGMAPASHSFDSLEQGVTEEYSILREDLSDGSVSANADLLVLMAPEDLDERAVFALDQYLMRGGTVLLATSPFSVELAGEGLRMRGVDSGLGDWLAHHGISLDDSLILDRQHGAFPVPVVRRIGGYEFRDMQFVDYPYFLELREPGLNPAHPVTSGLPNLSLAWASPLSVEPAPEREQVTLLQTSPQSWRSDDPDVQPTVGDGASAFPAPAQGLAAETVGVLLQGRFDSYFDTAPAAPAAAEGDEQDARRSEDFGALLRRSPAAARLLVVSSNDFASDQVLSGLVAASGTQYLSPVEFMLGAIDWALADGSLLGIRSRAHFNRTLPPLSAERQAAIEYLNYGLCLTLLGLLALAHHGLQRRRRNRYRRTLA